MATRKLMPHQLAGVEYCHTRKHPALLMEMRLGKTWTAIKWIQELHATETVERCLVVAPTTVMRSWRNELRQEDEHSIILGGLSANDRKQAILNGMNHKHRVWFLINYETLLRMPWVSTIPWDAVILDESTRIKNPKAKITNLCVEGFRTAKHRMILAGSVAPESNLDVYCQFAFLHGVFMGHRGVRGYWGFRNANFLPEDRGGWTPKFGSGTAIKAAVHSKAYVVRRADVNVGSKKVYSTRYVTPTKEQREASEKALDDFAYEAKGGEEVETEYAIVRSTWMARIAGGFSPDREFMSDTKIRELFELLNGELSDEPVVIWFRFNAEMAKVEQELSDAGISVTSIAGEGPSSNPEERERRRAGFMSGRYRVLLAQIKCAKYGIDCSRASTAIYYSNSYSCEERTQSEDRIIHPTKTDLCLIIDLVTEGSIDEEVVPKLQNKTFNARWFMTRFGEMINSRRKTAK